MKRYRKQMEAYQQEQRQGLEKSREMLDVSADNNNNNEDSANSQSSKDRKFFPEGSDEGGGVASSPGANDSEAKDTPATKEEEPAPVGGEEGE